MDLLYFVLCAFGITQIIVYGSIFDRIRPTCGEMGKLFHCTMCMGFWVGVFLLVTNRFTELFTFEHTLANYFILGCVSSGTSYILNTLFCDDGLQIGVRK